MAHAAKAELVKQGLKIAYPQDLPGSPLTIILEGVPQDYSMKAPKGGLLYRRGTTVWLTTPMLGKPGTKIPMPMKVVFAGDFQPEVALDEPVKLAGVRLFQTGGGSKDEFQGKEVFVEAEAVDGSITKIPLNKWSPLRRQYGFWEMITPLPEGTAPSRIKKIRVHPPLKYYKKLEIWAVK